MESDGSKTLNERVIVLEAIVNSHIQHHKEIHSLENASLKLAAANVQTVFKEKEEVSQHWLIILISIVSIIASLLGGLIAKYGFPGGK